MQSRVQEAEETMKREKQKCKERIAEVEREFLDKEKVLNDKLKREMNQLIQEQIKEIQEMQGEFAQASELLDQKYK